MNNIVPKSVQNIADKHARNNGYIRAQFVEKIKNSFFFTAIQSDEPIPAPIGLPFDFVIKGSSIIDLPAFSDFIKYA